MDMTSFQQDLKHEALKLPRELLETLLETFQKLAGAFGPALEGTLPGMIENMKPHLMTLFTEAAMGVLDKDEVEKTVMGVLTEVLSVKVA